MTGTINAANRSYYERAREPRRITSRIVPTGVALSNGGRPADSPRAGRARVRRHPAMDPVSARRALPGGGGTATAGGGASRLLPAVPANDGLGARPDGGDVLFRGAPGALGARCRPRVEAGAPAVSPLLVAPRTVVRVHRGIGVRSLLALPSPPPDHQHAAQPRH